MLGSGGDVSTRRRALAVALVTAPVMALAACGGGDAGSEWIGSVQDSAGISIITSSGDGAWDDASRWSVVEELRIGVASGDPELQFGLITGVDADDEGNIYVLDAQASRIRVFSPDGEFLTGFGRAGGGPGELSAAQAGGAQGLFITQDGNLLVPDMGNMRMARFSPEGEALESAPLDFTQGIPLLWAASEDRVVHRQTRNMALPGMPAVGENPQDRVVRLHADGTVQDTLGSFAAGGTFSMGAGGAPEIRFFSPEPVWAITTDGRLVEGLNSEYSLRVWEPESGLTTIVRRDFTRRPVAESDRSGFRSAMTEAWSEAGMPPEMVTTMMGNVSFEENWPALAAAIGGPDGSLWVQRVDPERAMNISTAADIQSLQFGSSRWDVFHRDGRFLGALDLPEGFAPRRVQGDVIYGVHQDDLGVQRVVRLRVVRP